MFQMNLSLTTLQARSSGPIPHDRVKCHRGVPKARVHYYRKLDV